MGLVKRGSKQLRIWSNKNVVNYGCFPYLRMMFADVDEQLLDKFGHQLAWGVNTGNQLRDDLDKDIRQFWSKWEFVDYEV